MANIFDPLLIICQIIALQCYYYLAMGTAIGITHSLFDKDISLDNFFTPRYTDLTTVEGWLEALCMLITSLAG